MKKGYWVNAYRAIHDEAAQKAYTPLAIAAIEAFGGKFLTTGASRVEAHEAGVATRTIIVEFESYETALAARKSEAYQKALEVLGNGAERDARIVEGA